jgi:hypothetical protein
LPEVIDFASGNGYQGIEIRGILGKVDLTKCPDFSSKERIVSSRKMFCLDKVKGPSQKL